MIGRKYAPGNREGLIPLAGATNARVSCEYAPCLADEVDLIPTGLPFSEDPALYSAARSIAVERDPLRLPRRALGMWWQGIHSWNELVTGNRAGAQRRVRERRALWSQ